MQDDALPIRSGDSGEAVADLQRRLTRTGLPCTPDPQGVFLNGTRAALEAFQHRRGLRVDGICGQQTWNALVEGGFKLGDRFVYYRKPMLRGDDVADLQHRLSALGFDTGRVDGIFGELTAGALGEFQRNMGLAIDGILGGDTLRELRRVSHREEPTSIVSTVRARERLRNVPPTLQGCRIAIGEEGGLDALVSAIRRRLSADGALVVPVLHPSGSTQANLANSAAVHVYLGLRLDPTSNICAASYYAGYRYESPGGKRLAELVLELASKALGVSREEAKGMSLPVLRETQMPAVLCEVGDSSAVVHHTADLAQAFHDALLSWAAAASS